MKNLCVVRDVREQLMQGRDGKPDWTLKLLVIEEADPLELKEVRLGRNYENQIDQLRQLIGKQCIVPMQTTTRQGNSRVFVSHWLTGMPHAVQQPAQQPKAVNS